MTRRPRIAVDLRAVVRSPTGIGIYTLAILRELAERGEFDLLGLAHSEPGSAPALRAMGVEVEVSRAPLGVIWQQTTLVRRLAQGDVDLFWSPLLTLPVRSRLPAVVTLHDLAVLHVPESLPLKVRWSLLPLLARTVDRASRILVGTHRVGREVESAFPAARGKIQVIPHGVDDGFHPADEAERTATRERLGAPGGYFVAVGTLEPRKNIGQLLDAWPLVRSEPAGADARLFLIGPDGWKEGALRRRLRRLEPQGVVRLGHIGRAEQAAILRGATALVYPSVYEGFGLPVAESLACGVPVIVGEETSPAEVAGEAGVCCAPDSPEELAAAMLRLLADRSHLDALARRARSRGAMFSWSRAAAAHSSAFRAALEAGRG